MNWLRRLFHKSRAESELDKELRFHLEQQISGYLAAGIGGTATGALHRPETGSIFRYPWSCWQERLELPLDSYHSAVLSMRPASCLVFRSIISWNHAPRSRH
jgi:hypothetical protein